jgi:hypothetical protein
MRQFIESLESREFLSASPIKHSAIHHKHHHKPKSQAVVAAAKPVTKAATVATAPAAAPVAWNDLAGNWAGTFWTNIAPGGKISASFQNRQSDGANTGTFNLTALIGQNNCLTTTTPDAYGNVLVTVPVKGGIVSFVSGISYDGQYLYGTWCTHIGYQFVTGQFKMQRV